MNHPATVAPDACAPYVSIENIEDRDLSSIPDLEQFQQLAEGETVRRSYDIRVRTAKFPWLIFVVTFITVVLPILIGLWYWLWPKRGHTFLYLTDRRVIIVELEQGVIGRQQTVLNFNNDDVAGFQVFTQNGVWRLFDMINLRKKQNFYISLLTGSAAGFTLGALSSRRSPYEAGRDAVTLCAELDSTLLAIKSGAQLSGARA